MDYNDMAKRGLVVIEIVPDNDWDVDNMCGDTFNPDINTDISPERLEFEKSQYLEKIRDDGVFGVTLKMFTGGHYETIDSLWGIDSYAYADTEVRKEMEATAVAYAIEHNIGTCSHCGARVDW